MRFIYEKEGKRFEYHIPEGNMIVGRDRKADIAIFDHNISRHHITVVRRDTMVQIRDLGSRNGTYVNNTRITDSELKPGDIVRLGNLSLFFDDGSPGLEIPSDLEGHMADKMESRVDDSNPTPVDGSITPQSQAPPQAPALPAPVYPQTQGPPPLPPGFQPPPGVEVIQRGSTWFLREPTTGREVEYVPPPPGGTEEPPKEADVISAKNLNLVLDRAKEFYRGNKTAVLIGAGVFTAVLLAAAVIRTALTPAPDTRAAMPVKVYDDLLDQGVDHFADWIKLSAEPPKRGEERKHEKSKKSKFQKALKFFQKIDDYVPDRQTGAIMINVMQAWSQLPDDVQLMDWSEVRRYLDELVNHPNVTPRAKEFARNRVIWMTSLMNSWNQARVAQNL
ncbi:MAG: FHA domain-containing protein, partial [Planctomycetota bacterium]